MENFTNHHIHHITCIQINAFNSGLFPTPLQIKQGGTLISPSIALTKPEAKHFACLPEKMTNN